MQYSPARELRERLYRAYNIRASEFGPPKRDNTPLLEEILTIRQEQAQLIGYADYAQMALGRRMADSPEAALDFLRDLATKARSHAEEEMAELRAFAADKLAIKNLQAWDVSFASEHLRRSKYNFSDAELRPYLNENRVLAGVFDCARRLFGIHAEEAEASLWDKDARFVHIKNADGKTIGACIWICMPARPNAAARGWAKHSVVLGHAIFGDYRWRTLFATSPNRRRA